MQSGQAKSAESRAGSSAGSMAESSKETRGKQEEPRTSGNAGPYLARRIFASGWGLEVGGLTRRHQVPSTQHSVLGTLYSVSLR
jgi:hypothetical protein